MELKVTEIKIVVDSVSWIKHGCNDGEIIKVGDTINTARDENGVEYVPIYVDDYDASNPEESAIITVQTGGITKDIELRRCNKECSCGMFTIEQKSTENISKDGGTFIIAYYEIRGEMESMCDLSSFICKSSSDFVTNITHDSSNKTFAATFKRNDGVERSAKFSFYYNGNVCKSFTLTQDSNGSHQTCNENYDIVSRYDIITCNGGTLIFVAEGGGEDEFDTMLNEFNSVLLSRRKTQISSSLTPRTYNYLHSGYERALQEYDGNSPLFDENNYGEIYQYRGDNTEYRDTAKQAMLYWLMAEQLSELYADSGKTTNTQTELYKKAYELGGGRSVPVYNNNDIHSDVFIARYAASAIYAITRSNYTFAQMDYLFRSETHTNPIGGNVSWLDLGMSTYKTCNLIPHTDNKIGYALNLNDIFPSAPGPFAENYYYCSGDAPYREYPHEQPTYQFNSSTNNYNVDENIYTTVINNYNLSSNNINLARTVQAVADESDNVYHLFGNETYYKYNPNNPRFSFEVGTELDNMGSFSGTFNSNVTGKDLSSSLIEGGTETALADFFSGIIYISSESRKTLLDVQYGRRRPGQGVNDKTPKCQCDSGCNTNLNELNDESIRRLVGSGTKYNEEGTAHNYFIDKNGNGYWDNGEPYYSDGQGGTSSLCPDQDATTYPSGHSSGVWGAALFLIQMIPGMYDKIYKAAYDFTVSRTIVRAHWNSDTMYGKLVGGMIVPILNAFNNNGNENFRIKYNGAKQMIDIIQ